MYTHQTRVSASQIGKDGYQTLTSLINTMQDCSQFGLDEEQMMADYFKQHNLTLMLASRQVDIKRYPIYGEVIETSTGIYDCKPAMGLRNTHIKDSDGNTIAQSWSVGAIVSLETGKLARIPKEVLSSLTIDPKLEMEYLGRRIDVPEGEPCRKEAMPTQPSDIDFNQHVNNVQFIRMATEHLPDGFKPSRMRVEYKHQAKLGDTIHPLVYGEDGQRHCIELISDESRRFAVLEFSA